MQDPNLVINVSANAEAHYTGNFSSTNLVYESIE